MRCGCRSPGQLAGTSAPVSYTHLDVYKRQDWLQARRDAADRERRRQHLAAARQHLEAGALDAALAAAEVVLATDPAVEEAHRLRMEAFYLRGDRAAAITAWDDCRDALRTAYGLSLIHI